MKHFKWIAISILIIVISIILYQTFTQEIFTDEISILIFVYRTPAIPVYLYVIGAFFIGLLIGLIIAMYNFFVYKGEKRKNKKKIKQLEKDMETLGSHNKVISHEIHPSQMRTSTREIHEMWEEGDNEDEESQDNG
jgi:uncharacterized integral membrane protein